MEEYLLSAGIDIGTSTTQLIFSRLFIQNSNGFGMIPKIEVMKKEIIYRSPIYLTPLCSENEIDLVAVKSLIKNEYLVAGIKPEEVSTGAVIITGETSRKRNANEVVHALSDLAGDFVVATAGPNLESVLAGKGSGAAALSEETGKLVANLDIGGGTTNICYFKEGKVVDMACLNIGGRLIKVEDGIIRYISPKLQALLEQCSIPLYVGEAVEKKVRKRVQNVGVENITFDDKKLGCQENIIRLVKEMVRILEESVSLAPPSIELNLMKTNQLITYPEIPELITFSGGVADCIWKNADDSYLYGDIGILLGEEIRKSERFAAKMDSSQTETINATVIGAGNYSMEVSGSTIEYQNCPFPLKNIPVISFSIKESELGGLQQEIEQAVSSFLEEEEETVQFALATKGIACPTFHQIEGMAGAIVRAMERQLTRERTLILVLEADIGKALGQAMKRLLPRGTAFLCIDHISCKQGDYIDIGEPVASGKVVPVVVKTLIFNT